MENQNQEIIETEKNKDSKKVNNTIKGEFKPRTWLLTVLIIMALVILVVLIYGIVQAKKENSKEETNNKEETELENFISDIVDEYSDVESFNRTLENRSGTESRSFVPDIIDEVLDSNKKNSEHLITVCYQEVCTTDDTEIRAIKKNFTENISMDDPDWFEKTTKKYDIILDYDEEGYINKVTIGE